MKIGVVMNPYANDVNKIFEEVKQTINQQGHELVYFMQNHTIKDVDYVLACGGDGTVLGAARHCGEIPIMPFNMGHLGFLTDGKYVIQDLSWVLGKIKRNEFEVETRHRLEAKVNRPEFYDIKPFSALNDIVIKAAIAKTVRLMLFIDDNYVGEFPADGIMVSTATGSTGYNISAGGPIIQPHMPINVITPICSHKLSVRSILTSEEQKIRIVIGVNHEEVVLSADGQDDIRLESRDVIDITTSRQVTNIIRIGQPSFFKTLTKKMGWGE
jgi:NAD+ kinase